MARYIDWSNEPIEVLGLTVRGFNCARRLGVTTIGELCQHTAQGVMNSGGFPETALAAIRTCLARVGLRLLGD